MDADQHIAENEIIITITSRPDSRGRCQFELFWLADNVGWACNQHGIRGQVFYADPDDFAEEKRRQGVTVRYVTGDTSEPGGVTATRFPNESGAPA